MSTQSKLERLEEAGILEKRDFSASELELLETITDEEISVLIQLRKKMGPTAEDKHHIRPNILI